MTLQYTSTFNPDQQRKFWYERVIKEKVTRNKAYEQWKRPFGSWLTPIQFNSEANYFDNNKTHPKSSIYDRTTDYSYNYNQKLHRDDRASKVGLDILKEERSKKVPILSSSAYGFRPAIEAPMRDHVRVQWVQKGFFRSNGTNIPLKANNDSIKPAK